jgi:hypothetical protein
MPTTLQQTPQQKTKNEELEQVTSLMEIVFGEQLEALVSWQLNVLYKLQVLSINGFADTPSKIGSISSVYNYVCMLIWSVFKIFTWIRKFPHRDVVILAVICYLAMKSIDDFILDLIRKKIFTETRFKEIMAKAEQNPPPSQGKPLQEYTGAVKLKKKYEKIKLQIDQLIKYNTGFQSFDWKLGGSVQQSSLLQFSSQTPQVQFTFLNENEKT